MILLVSLIEEENSLHHMEFVVPVEKEVKERGHETRTVHYSKLIVEDVPEAEGIILCGTALGDNAILNEQHRFSWLETISCPVLGICVGANLLCLALGGEVERCLEIGPVRLTATVKDPLLGELNEKEVYDLHALAPLPPDSVQILARSEACVQAFKKDSFYGLLFHPEVRHGDIIGRFCSLASEKGEMPEAKD
ncbi:MAG: glutamine amidotransferase [Thermoplasmata archaeon]|nr:glutamine amidotransferase [Thermoplasmata archaeon]